MLTTGAGSVFNSPNAGASSMKETLDGLFSSLVFLLACNRSFIFSLLISLLPPDSMLPSLDPLLLFVLFI